MKGSDSHSKSLPPADESAKPQRAALLIVLLLCVLSCVLFLTVNPVSVAVDSVYKGF